MHELMIERWNNRDGTADHLWSLWTDGKRVQMGGPHRSAAEAEKEALAYCQQELGRNPDRITRL